MTPRTTSEPVSSESPSGSRLRRGPHKERFHGWTVCIAGAIIQALQAGLFVQGFGNLAVVLRNDFGWSKTTLSLGYSMTRAESALLGPIQGWALDRFGVKSIMRLGAVTMASGFILLSQIQSKFQFFGALLIVAIGASLSGFLSVTTGMVQWFERKRARALSLSSIGFGVGGLLAPVFVLSLEKAGWRWTVAGSGVLFLAVTWPLTSAFGWTPETKGQPIDGIAPQDLEEDVFKAEGLTKIPFTAGEAIRTRAFWMISLGHGFALLVVGAVMAHLSLYLTGDQDFTLRRASLVMAVLPIFQIVGQLSAGILGDRYNKRWLAAGAMVGHMVGLLLLAFAVSEWMIWAFAPVHGLAWGLRGPLMQALRADYFGTAAFGKIMGLSSLIVMLGTVGGPLLAGITADATGSYRLGFTILALTAGFGLTFFVLATPPPRPPSHGPP